MQVLNMMVLRRPTYNSLVNYSSARFYKYAMKEVQSVQRELMESSLAALAVTEQRVVDLLRVDPYSPASHSAVINMLTTFTNQQVSIWSVIYFLRFVCM